MKARPNQNVNLAAVQLRAAALARLRTFFSERNVVEVDTPSLSEAATPDPHLRSLEVAVDGGQLYLHTSPEFGMKRLLAAGAGDIYQVCRVYRDGEDGHVHRREFTMVEWYRLGYSMTDLMTEVLDLCEYVGGQRFGPAQSRSFGEAFKEALGIDWRHADSDELRNSIRAKGVDPGSATQRQELIELALAAIITPRLGRRGAEFLTHFPAAMAALADLNPEKPDTADRFELFVAGIELANGFRELTDPIEQRRRFASELERRGQMGLPQPPLDERFLAALEEGLPPCSGVALGFDRLLMVASGNDRLDPVLPFPQG